MIVDHARKRGKLQLRELSRRRRRGGEDAACRRDQELPLGIGLVASFDDGTGMGRCCVGFPLRCMKFRQPDASERLQHGPPNPSVMMEAQR